MKEIEMTAGSRFGHLTVLEKDARRISGNICYKCRCDCGAEIVVPGSKLRTGETTSCGKCFAAWHERRPAGPSGKRGVRYSTKSRKWEATISFGGTRKYLGQYADFDDAAAARDSAENILHRSGTLDSI